MSSMIRYGTLALLFAAFWSPGPAAAQLDSRFTFEIACTGNADKNPRQFKCEQDGVVAITVFNQSTTSYRAIHGGSLTPYCKDRAVQQNIDPASVRAQCAVHVGYGRLDNILGGERWVAPGDPLEHGVVTISPGFQLEGFLVFAREVQCNCMYDLPEIP